MLHWNSWWVQSDPGDEPPALPLTDPSAWTPEGWMAWQWGLWNRQWEASLAWWRLYGVTFPMLGWPPAAPAEEPTEIVHALPAPTVKAAATARRRAPAALRHASQPPALPHSPAQPTP